MNRKQTKLVNWIKNFNSGVYYENDLRTQIEAGWYDWFCKDSSLVNKTKRMGQIIKQIKEGGKVDLERTYVWFKNNCPLHGPLYDDFRISDINTNEVIYTIQISSCHEDSKFVVYGKKNSFKEPLFKNNSEKELTRWLNEGWNN